MVPVCILVGVLVLSYHLHLAEDPHLHQLARRFHLKEDCETRCRKAIALINKKEPNKLELVEAISYEIVSYNDFWFHLNFKARFRTPDGKGDSCPQLFFAEMKRRPYKITSFECLEPTDDAPSPKNGCAVCSPDVEPYVSHPGDGDFVLGSQNPNASSKIAYHMKSS